MVRALPARSLRHALLGMAALFMALSATPASAQQAIDVAGLYQGENLLVVNETNPDGVGFCCYEVRVNGLVTADQVNSHAFEIDLRSHGIALGKGVAVRLMHRPGCAPRILNPEVIAPSPGFELIEFEADDNGEVRWVTSEERGRMPFVLQQLKWGKWVDVVRVDGLGGPGERYYNARFKPVRGENILRLTHLAADGALEVKGEARFTSDAAPIRFDYDPRTERMAFSEETQYEVVNAFGTVVLQGHGKEVVLRYLARGEYFVNYGARSETFKKR